MTSDQLLTHIARPDKLDADTLLHLERLVARYPYFQTARLLFLKNLSEVRSLRFPDELKKGVCYCNDRRRLFALLPNNEYAWSKLFIREMLSAEDDGITVHADPFTLINSYLSQNDAEDYPEELGDLLPKIPVERTDYVNILLDQPDVPAERDDISDEERQKQELIDSFIEKGEKSAVFVPAEDSIPEPPKGINKDDSLIQEDSFLTESLAKIYIKQKKYSKALEIIKKLSLKYPEKNVYFADQVRFLEKIITNIKPE